MKKIISIFITFFVVILGIIFLAINRTNNERKVNDKRIKVIATLFPQYDFIKQIGKEKVEVTLLLPPGTETHTYDPSSKDIMRINSSDLFIYTGKYMEPWANSISNSITSSVNIVDVSNGIEYLKEEHDDDSEVHEDAHEHEYDPHIWLDISNAKIMVDNILKELLSIDSENANYYIKNAKEYKEKLDNLDNEFYEAIANGKRNILCFGDKFAYMYFISRYNLDYITAYDSCSVESEPSVAKVLELENRIKKENIPVIFYEYLSQGKIAKSIAGDVNIKALVFSSVHNVSSDDIKNGATYISIMRENLNNLKIALN